MEEIVNKLLIADNSSIQQGTQELQEAFKNPEAIPALCQLIVTSSNPQIRQSSAVLLRKRLAKSRNWAKLTAEVKTGIKQLLLQALVNEPEKLVKNAIAQFIGTVSKHELPNENWPEVLQFVQTLSASESMMDKELAMYTLSIMTEIAVDQYLKHAESFGFLFTNTLNSIQDLSCPLAYYTVLTMTHFVPLIHGNQQMINVYNNLLPRVMDSIKAFIKCDEKKACEMMEILDELVESAPAVVVPHIKPLIEMCLQIATEKDIDDSVKVKAVSFVGWLTRTKKKSVVKLNLVESIVNVLFKLMSLAPEDEGEEEYFTGDPDSCNPMTCATQTLDILALNIPPEKLIPHLLQFIEPALQSNDLYAKKASYLAMAVLAEGCSEYIRTKYLQSFLMCISKGITEPSPVVRNAALFALGQFSEHLQPDISQYASQLLPVLFDFLSQLCNQLQNSKEPPSIDRMFYALEMFCENLEEEILPYLDTLMERLFMTLNPNCSVHLRELALSAIGSTAAAAKEGLLPYFPRIIECLKIYLMQEYNEETSCLQVQAIDTLGMLARTIGHQNFLPLAQESLQLGLKLMDSGDDPDLRKSTFGLFASIATVIKEDINPLLPKIVETMLDSIKSSEGIVPQYKEEETSVLDVYDDLSNSADEEDIEKESSEEDDDDVAGYTVENSYVEEKEEACHALREIAKHTGNGFLPYIETCFEEIFKLINYPQEDIRKASIEALLQFSLCLSKINSPEGKQALYKALQMLVPKCAELIRMDDERSVVMAALDTYAELLKELKGEVFVGEGHREAIMNCVIDVMTCKTECQDQDQGDAEDPEAEHDELLIECAGDIIPKFGKAIRPDDFVVYFNNLLTLFLIRTKKQNSISQRSFAIGTIAECMEPLQQYVERFVPQLLPFLMKSTKDEQEEIRNNSIFAIGEMVLHGKEALYPHYGEILQTLSAAVAKETHPGCLDNICGALARMIIANINAVPMSEVFPVFVRYLPLREDYDENKAVFNCISQMYQLGHPLLSKHLGAILSIAVTVVHKNQVPDDDTKNLIVNLIKTMQQDFPDVFNSTISTLDQEVSASVQQLFTSN